MSIPLSQRTTRISTCSHLHISRTPYMKKWLFIGLVFAVVVLIALLHGLAASERRATFIHVANNLLEAHLELQHDGVFTNHFRDTDITAVSNTVVVLGTNYQCEFTAANNELRDYGRLAITTNQMVIWIDRNQQISIIYSRDIPFKYPPSF